MISHSLAVQVRTHAPRYTSQNYISPVTSLVKCKIAYEFDSPEVGGRPKGGTLAALDVTARPVVWEPAMVLENNPGPYSHQEQSKLG